jgi:hypothetical protein
MSSLVLLSKDGEVTRKLHFVSLPHDFVVPEGMMISWRTEIECSWSRHSPDRYVEPLEAYFYLGSAQAQVCRGKVKEFESNTYSDSLRYQVRILSITVQGTLAKDVMTLRDHILNLIDNNVRWDVSNDLNPKLKSGILSRILLPRL